jgi:heme oxygenase
MRTFQAVLHATLKRRPLQIMPSLLPQLRRETAQAHARLENSVQIEDCLKNLDRYRDLLKKFLGFYQPVEAVLESVSAWDDWGIDLSQRRKSPWLQQDLAALGLSTEDISALPRCSDLPKIHHPAQAFGCAYVLEGSTLGGRHISKLLEGSPIPTNARNFFFGHGPQVLPLWKSFCSALESFGESIHQTDQVVQAANDTFESLQHWMNQDHKHA